MPARFGPLPVAPRSYRMPPQPGRLLVPERALPGLAPRVAPTLDLGFDLGQFDPRLTFVRSGSDNYRFNREGWMELVSPQKPRFDFDPLTGTASGVLVESGMNNRCLYSNDVHNAAWSKNGDGTPAYTVGNEAIAPDGTLTAAGFYTASGANTWTGACNMYSTYDPPDATWFHGSLHYKKDNNKRWRLELFGASYSNRVSADIDLDLVAVQGTPSNIGNFTNAGAGVIELKNGWRRAWIRGKTGTGETQINMHTAPENDSGSDYISNGERAGWLWGGQIEQSSAATAGISSLVPTTSVAVARYTDEINMPNIKDWYRQDEGTFFVECWVPDEAYYDPIICLGDGTSSNHLSLFHSTSPNNNLGYQIVSGGSQANGASEFYTASAQGQASRTWRKVAIRYGGTPNGAASGGKVAISVKGVLTRPISGSGVMPVVDRLSIGNFSARGGGVGSQPTKFRRVTYWPLALDDNTLMALTR